MAYKLSREQALQTIENIRNGIQSYFKENNLTYAIFGKSEGLDSSVIAGLLSNLDGVRPIGVIIPIESNPEAERIANIVLDHYDIPKIRVDLSREHHLLMERYYSADGFHDQVLQVLQEYGDQERLNTIESRKPIAGGNIKVRLRMITLYHLAQLTGGVVMSTDNLSELWMGFWTINGDVGDIAPIQNIWKGLEEYEVAKALGVPEESLNAVPTDGLDITPGGTDEDQLGLPYSDLDRVIVSLLQNRFNGIEPWEEAKIIPLADELGLRLGYDKKKIIQAARQMANTNHKRHWPRVFRRDEIGLPDIEDLNV